MQLPYNEQIRDHWDIERTYWVLDVSFGEDQSRKEREQCLKLIHAFQNSTNNY